MVKRETKRTLTAVVLLLFVILITIVEGQAQDSQTKYPTMASIDQYLMPDRDAEIALARSAAPKAISDDAKILVLGRHGFETAVQGKNGFVCVVERSWMSPSSSTEFWNPRLRGPICYNPPGVRSVLPILYKRTEMALAGQSKTEIVNGTKAALGSNQLPALEPGAMSYMMSKQAYLTDAGDHNMAHLMIYTPHMDAAAWGADLPGSPVMFGASDPVNLFLIPIGKWSDGTPAPTE
jgi:hypothetical protein